jgi:hypothetical protein
MTEGETKKKVDDENKSDGERYQQTIAASVPEKELPVQICKGFVLLVKLSVVSLNLTLYHVMQVMLVPFRTKYSLQLGFHATCME